MKTDNIKCLLLNIDFSPIAIIHWQKAITWYFKYQYNNKYEIEIIDFYKNDYIVGVNNKKFPIPAVCKTKRFFNLTKNKVTFSRKNIFIRDEYTCQYCHKKIDGKYLTYDHVIPKSLWSANTTPTCWTNIVTSCVSCNRKKGNRTPKQANMPLKQIPVRPEKKFRYLPIYEYLCNIKEMPEEWKIYLPEFVI
jgi:hypothetical protein